MIKNKDIKDNKVKSKEKKEKANISTFKIKYVVFGFIITLIVVFIFIAIAASFPNMFVNTATSSNTVVSNTFLNRAFPVRSIILINKANNTKKYFNVYIAAAPQLMQQGYMNSTTLGNCNNEGNCLGMLFLFNRSQNICMWMKNTEIPLNQIWFNSNGIIVKEMEATPYSTNVICGYGQYVLETNRSIPLNDIITAP